jgi:hypothetical protein
MGKRSMRRDWENQADRTAPRARVSVLDLIRASPYGPAASAKPHQEAEQTSAPDHMPPEAKFRLHPPGRPHTSGLTRPTDSRLRQRDYRAAMGQPRPPSRPPSPPPRFPQLSRVWCLNLTNRRPGESVAGHPGLLSPLHRSRQGRAQDPRAAPMPPPPRFSFARGGRGSS